MEGEAEDFAAILYAEPGALGLISNIVAALMIATENCLDPPFSSAALVLSGNSNTCPGLQDVCVCGGGYLGTGMRSVVGYEVVEAS